MNRQTQISVDLGMLAKYDRPGPRYTSYPTAPNFSEKTGEKEYRAHIASDERSIENRDLSLYFHLPFCDTLCYFCGCNMMVTRRRDKIDRYIDYLEKEIALLRSLLGADRKVVQLHWGGGTPTHLSPDEIRRLGEVVHRHFEFREDAENGVEIDPRELTFDHMQALRECGFNRCSIGVQDFNEQVQKAVNRIQPEAVTRQAVEWARELGFGSLNLDLMYGLPFQTRKTYETTLEKILGLNPDRLAVFNYAHLPGSIRHQRLIKDEWLPTREVKLQLLKMSIETLSRAGYVYIGMDHFAVPQDELSIALEQGTLYRNFQGYSTHSGINLFALGITGIGMLSDMYAQNYKTLPEYYDALDRGRLPVYRGIALTADDRLRREVITHLMCQFRVDLPETSRKWNIDFEAYFAGALESLRGPEEDGLIELGRESLTVTPAGRLLIRNLAMAFDAHLGAQEGKTQFSRTV
jgi:oxygen-independent coproporphyrinogen III oxidase